jgi:hypothetical protein
MKLLEEIQSSAVDVNSDIGTLLRKCKLLAARLGSQPLEDWLIWESNGYPDDVPVPDYRIWPLEIRGHFAGALGSGLRNVTIPYACLPEEVREHYENYKCRQSIATIEAMLSKATGGTLYVGTSDLVVTLGQNVYENMNCIQVWAQFGTSALVELLNSVRNLILDFALAIWKEAPNAGDLGNSPSTKLESARVNQIFNTIVYGGSSNIVGTSNAFTISFNIEIKDFSSLERVLRSKGVPQEDIAELRSAVDSEPSPTAQDKFGPRVSAWIAKMVGKAAEGSWNISLGAAGNLLAQAISKYYGF